MKKNNSLFSPLVASTKIVERVDSAELRIKIFEDIARRKKLIGFIFAFYRLVRHTPLGPLMIMAYGAKCFLCMGIKPTENSKILSISSFENEKKAIDWIADCVDETSFSHISQNKKNLLNPNNYRVLASYIKTIPQLYKLAKRITKKHSFMPSCRIFSTISYYLRAHHILRQNVQIGAVITASNYSPDAMGLIATAEKLGRKVIYTNHANVPLKMPVIPPGCGDLLILSGKSITDTYNLVKQVSCQVVYKGLQGDKETLKIDRITASNIRIGIFLTGLSNHDTIQNLIVALTQSLDFASILVRPHPNPLVFDHELAKLLSQFPDNVTLSSNQSPLRKDVNACDLVICGNTGAILDILSFGTAAMYLATLDQNPYDYNGFIKNGLVPEIVEPYTFNIDEIRSFYGTGWDQKMRYYDAGYLKSDDRIKAEIKSAILSLLNERE